MTGADGVIEQTLRIQARPETVWRYWTDPERMCDWWGRAAELHPEPGGTCRVEMGDSTNAGPVMSGRYLELEPHHRLVFSFGWESSDGAPPEVPPGSTRVEVTLVPDGDDTILTLRHHGLPAQHTAEHGGGWAHFLGILAERLNGYASTDTPELGAADLEKDRGASHTNS